VELTCHLQGSNPYGIRGKLKICHNQILLQNLQAVADQGCQSEGCSPYKGTAYRGVYCISPCIQHVACIHDLNFVRLRTTSRDVAQTCVKTRGSILPYEKIGISPFQNVERLSFEAAAPVLHPLQQTFQQDRIGGASLPSLWFIIYFYIYFYITYCIYFNLILV
jgi:hypothetical protein